MQPQGPGAHEGTAPAWVATQPVLQLPVLESGQRRAVYPRHPLCSGHLNRFAAFATVHRHSSYPDHFP